MNVEFFVYPPRIDAVTLKRVITSRARLIVGCAGTALSAEEMRQLAEEILATADKMDSADAEFLEKHLTRI
jgi:hypothetical protein